jgi:PAS domain S-box-containing protein
VSGEQVYKFRTVVQGIAARISAAALVVGLFALVLIGGVWFLTFESIQHDLEEARASEFKQNENLVLAHEEQVTRLLKAVDQLLLLLKSQYELRGTRIDLQTLFADGILDANMFTFVGVIDERGEIIASGRESGPTNLADREFFREHQRSDSNALRIGEPVVGRSSGRWTIPLTRRFNKPDGSFGGVVDIAVDTAYFTALFQKASLGPADVMALVRTDGIILARRRGDETSFGEDFSKSPLIAALAKSPVGSYSSIGVIDHVRKFFSYRKLQDYPVLVTVGTAELDTLAPVRKREYRSMVAAILGSVFIAAICALIIAMLLRQKRANARILDQLALIDQARDAIVVRGMDDCVQFWNRGAERLYGWTAAEARGQPLDTLLHSDPAKFRQATEMVLSEGDWIGEVTHQHRDGHAVTVDDHWTLLRDVAGQPKSILAIKTDITKRLSVEAQLRQSQRLEAVGQLTGGVAHDFNNLLTVILGNAEVLTEKLGSNPDLRNLAEMILSAALRGAELTGRLLAFARRQALDPKAVDANKLLVGMHDLLQRTLTENIEIRVVQGAYIWPALIDPGQLEDAILNLCLNARDAMPDGGRLTIETSNVHIDQDHAGQYADVEPGQYVLITVTDTGSGIAPKDLNQVFDPFFTTKEFGKGTGLGLSMVYGFVKQSRGHVKIYSEVGHGTAVKMYLPRASRIDGEREESPARPADILGTEKILLVEDDEYVLNYAKNQLVELGYRLFSARNGAEALEYLGQIPDVDLLFTDVVMPGGISGRELADQATKLRPALKVLYTSGYTENSIVHQGHLDKGVHLLNKPYRRSELAQKIRAALSESA